MPDRKQSLADFENSYDACICRLVYAACQYKELIIQDVHKPLPDNVPGIIHEFVTSYTKQEAAISEINALINP